MKNEILTCKDCHREFVFYVKEQRRFLSKDWKDPKRCPECRKKRKKTYTGTMNCRKRLVHDIIRLKEMAA